VIILYNAVIKYEHLGEKYCLYLQGRCVGETVKYCTCHLEGLTRIRPVRELMATVGLEEGWCVSREGRNEVQDERR
jgi:hypothetical protein